MNRIRGWTLFLVAGLVVGLLGFAAAAWVIVDHDEVNNNTFNTTSPVTVTVSTTPTSAIWTAVTAGEPGTIAVGKLRLQNSGAGTAYVNMTRLVTGTGVTTLGANLQVRVANSGNTDPGVCLSSLLANGNPASILPATEAAVGTLTAVAFNNLPIPSGQSAYLCFTILFPNNLTPAVQLTMAGLTSATTFIFDSDDTP